MQRVFWLAMTLLPLGGCYLPPPNADTGYQPGYPAAGSPPPGYPPPGYPPPGYPPNGYPPAAYDPNAAAYDYNGGAPTIIQEGVPVPLVLFGGEWGFYDRERHWHHAPDDVRRRMEEHRVAGPRFRPDEQRRDGGFGQARPEGRPAAFGEHPGGPAAFRPAEQARSPGPPIAAARPVQAPPPRPQEHDRRRDCPPNQRC